MSKFVKKVVIFDLDGALTKSKSAIEPSMAELVCKLLVDRKVAVISGGGYPQFLTQFVGKLPTSSKNYSNLYLLPTSGTRLYSWKGNWNEEYAENLTENEKKRILSALKTFMNSPSYEKPAVVYDDIIEDRGSQITYSALGQKASADIKRAWDPTRKKREETASFIHAKIPEFDIRVSGASSIDITRKGVNKGYGIMRLSHFLNIPIADMIFIGDALFYGGNDYPARSTGIDCVPVKGPEETEALIKSWLE